MRSARSEGHEWYEGEMGSGPRPSPKTLNLGLSEAYQLHNLKTQRVQCDI